MTRIIQIGLKNRIYIFWIDEFTDTNKLVILGIKTFKVFRQTTYGIMRRKALEQRREASGKGLHLKSGEDISVAMVKDFHLANLG